MKDDFKSWFAGLAVVPGMLACGVRRPGGKCVGHGDENKFPLEKIEKLLRRFAEPNQPMAATEFSPRWITWVFEYGHLRVVSHPDQWILLLLAGPETEAAQELDRLSEDFLARSFK